MAQFCELLNEEKLYKHVYLEVILDHNWSFETHMEVHANAIVVLCVYTGCFLYAVHIHVG